MAEYKTHAEINLLIVEQINFKDKDGVVTEIEQLKFGDTMLWSKGERIEVAFTINRLNGAAETFTFKVMQGMTWRDLAIAYPTNFVAWGVGLVTEETPNNQVVFGVYDHTYVGEDGITGLLVYPNDYWVVRGELTDEEDTRVNVKLDDVIIGDEHLELRARSTGVIPASGALPIGECVVQATGAGTPYTFTATSAGAYVFTADSDNALIGYEQNGAVNFAGNAFTVEFAEGEQITVICTTLDWQDEEYCLTIVEN